MRIASISEDKKIEKRIAITPEAAKALLMLLPELGALMEAIAGSGQAAPPNRPAPQSGPQMGALGGMS